MIIPKFRHICSTEGYFDHYQFFTTFFKNYKDAYELTERIHRDNFGHAKFTDYDSFRTAKHRWNKNKSKKNG